MKKRATVAEKFSTYLWRDDNDVLIWVSDRALQRHMAQMVDRHPEWDEKTWVMYWLEAARKGSDKHAVEHLRAYLEESCYWGAANAHQKYPTGNWSDYFQMARELAADPVKLWKNYDPQLSQPATYANKAFLYAILEQVRQKSEFDRSSDWGLLSKVSKTKLKKALKNASISEPQLSCYLLAWQCFQEICTLAKAKGSRKLESPTPAQLDEVANYYNDLRFPRSSETAVNGDRIHEFLLKCIQAVRAVYRFQNISLDANPVHADKAIACYSQAQSELQEAEAQEQAEWQEIKVVLAKAIATLPEEAHQMWFLEYGTVKLNKTEIGEVFGIDQSTVSRRLRKYKQPLLEAIAHWYQRTTGSKFTVAEINKLSKPLNQWLGWYYASISELLQTKLSPEHQQEITLLQWYLCQNLPPKKIAGKLKLSEQDVKEKVAEIKQGLQQELTNWMGDKISATCPLEKLVKNWLSNGERGILETERR